MTEQERAPLSEAERGLLARMRRGATLRALPNTAYYDVIEGGEAKRPRVQHKITRRLEQRGYLRYHDSGYTLTEAGEYAAKASR